MFEQKKEWIGNESVPQETFLQIYNRARRDNWQSELNSIQFSTEYVPRAKEWIIYIYKERDEEKIYVGKVTNVNDGDTLIDIYHPR